MTDRYDLVAIGGGTAAMVATLGVAGIGGRAALIEKERVGGDCLWTGCVPSKALLAAASAAQNMRTADFYGLQAVEPVVDWKLVMAAVRQAQAVIEPQDSPERLRANGVEVIEGRGEFVGPGQIQVGGRTLAYRAALIATGSQPVIPPIAGLAEADPLTSDNVWDLEDLPQSLVVLGGGPIGAELGQAFSRLGSRVTIVEAMDTLLPREASEVGQFLARRLTEEGVDVRTGVRAQAVKAGPGPSSGEGNPKPSGREHPWTLELGDGTSVDFDRILVAVGRRPNSADLGLGPVGVDLDDRGYVVVDPMMRTTGDHIYAAGDITGKMPFTHVAAHQGRLVVTNAMFKTRRSAQYDTIPWVTFTDPEIARVGLDAQEARDKWGTKAVIQRYDYDELDRAVTHGRNQGWVTLVGSPSRKLVGATIVGEAAGETVAEMVAWISNGAKIDAISNSVHAYPTFSEGPSRAADDLLRARFFNPKLTRLTGPVLSLLRRLDKPS